MEFYHSVNHLFQDRVAKEPNTVIVAVPDKALTYTKYTYRELDVAASILAKYYVDSGLLKGRARGDNSSRLVIGLISRSGFDYIVNELALFKLGYCILLLSPNNSPAAMVHLLKQTQAGSIITSASFTNITETALSTIPTGEEVPKLILQPSGDVYGPTARQRNWNISWQYPLEYEQETELPFVIIHSSGSTGYPKPVSINHGAGVANYSQSLGYRSFTTLPLYHNHGHSNLYRAFHSGQTLYLFPADLIPMTVDNILSLLKDPDCDAEAVYAVPLILTFLAESEEGIEILRNMKAVMFAGSALSDETGNKLVAAGVRLLGQMGLTETGQIGTSARDYETDKEWDYIRPLKHLRKYFRFDDQGDGSYELVVLDGYPPKVMSNQPDGSYRTKDLYRMHPTLECAFKFCGRLDDTLVMINAEKTNPVPMELSLRGLSPYIADVIVFGAARAQVGALILPSDRAKGKTTEELQTLIAPALSIANADAPSHSQLAPEAIVFLPYGTAIPRADKGNPIRARTYAAFRREIEDMYQRLEGDVDAGISKKRISSPGEARTLVFEVMRETLGDNVEGLDEGTDLFAFGLDSLQANRIRNAIQRVIDIGQHKLPMNFVFDHPSIKEIGEYLTLLTSESKPLFGSSQIDIMLNIVDTYRAFAVNVKRVVERPPLKEERCVVLTGITGSLGAHLLNEFLTDSQVATIYCLARAPSHQAAEERVAQSMATRGLTKQFQLQRHKISCFAVDFAQDSLGLSVEDYDELRRNATLIIHCAWPVNFNLGIGSFVPHITGAMNLMKLALETKHSEPAQFYFCSSISVVFSWPGPGQVPEDVIDDPHFAQQTGYARSKWVVEQLCKIASESSPLHARVLRIGQLVGDTQNGIWNESEAVSLIIKGAQTIPALPILEESPAWLPVDTAARVIHEVTSFVDQDYEGDGYCWHIVQPNRVPWSEILDYFEAAGLASKRVPPKEWLDFLRKSDQDPIRNPTIKLLGFFEEKYGYDEPPSTCYTVSTKKTEIASPTLRAVSHPDGVLVRRWVENWKKTGFLQ